VFPETSARSRPSARRVREGAGLNRHGPPYTGPRDGHTFIEVIVVLLALSIITAVSAASLTTVTRLGRIAGDEAERLAARRTFALLVAWEVGSLMPGPDGLQLSADTFALRAFRGRGVVCAVGSTTRLNYRGLRAPDATKDSLLVLEGRTAEHTLPYTGGAWSPGSCVAPAGEQTLEVTTPGLDLHDIVLFFERGSYHIANGALRYRRGPGGRQPVTADVFVPDSTRLGLSIASKTWGIADTAGLDLRIATEPVPPSSAPSVWPLRVPIRNTRVPLDSATDSAT